MAERMSEERLAEIRKAPEDGLLTHDMIHDLLAEVDRLKKENVLLVGVAQEYVSRIDMKTGRMKR